MSESRADEVGIIRRQAVQELLHFVTVNAENFCRTQARRIRITYQPLQVELIPTVSLLREFIQRVKDNSPVVNPGLCALQSQKFMPVTGSRAEV